MSDNQIWISIDIRKGCVTKEAFKDVVFWLLHKNYKVSQTNNSWVKDSRDFSRLSQKEYVDLVVNNIFATNKESDIPEYIFSGLCEVSYSEGNNSVILLELNRSSLDAGYLSKSTNLDSVYDLANGLIDYVKYIWEYFGSNSLYVTGDWQGTYSSLHELKMPISENLYHFWLSIVPDSKLVSEKFAYCLTFDGEFKDFLPWYKKEKLVNGTLLLASPLPWWAINEKPKQTFLEKLKNEWCHSQWSELEKRWKKLEK